MVKVALIGYGKMGKKIEELAPQVGVEVVAKLTSTKSITKKSLEKADVCIDFSHPEAAFANIKKLASLQKPLVMGTSGWYEQLEEVEELIKENKAAFLYAENFSIGVQIFNKIVECAAELLNTHEEYDISIHEEHHSEKVDSPSGTALLLAETILDKLPRKEGDLLLSSHRMGSIPGTHKVLIDSLFDTITLTHSARNREGFALGALAAAKWLHNKKGFYHLKEIL